MFNFTSSQIHKLTSNGRAKDSIGTPFYTYVNEVYYATCIGRKITNESNAKPTNWGRLIELWFASRKMGLESNFDSKKRYYHLELPWSGAPDYLTGQTVGDIKSPWTPLSYCQMYDVMQKGNLEEFKKEIKEYYWQLVSNMILSNSKECELTINIPYEDELDDIREFAQGEYVNEMIGANNVQFVHYMDNEQLPYIKRDAKFKDYITFKFTPPKEDVEFLKERVKLASLTLSEKL